MSTHFCNLLLTNQFPFGREKVGKRNKGDWFHSVAIFSDRSITSLKVGESMKCCMIHFFKGPTLAIEFTKVKFLGKEIYEIKSYKGSYAVISHIRGPVNESSVGETALSIEMIQDLATQKWGLERIPYAHGYAESYNCVGFTDDILYLLKHGEWNPRVCENQVKYGLTQN